MEISTQVHTVVTMEYNAHGGEIVTIKQYEAGVLVMFVNGDVYSMHSSPEQAMAYAEKYLRGEITA